MVNEAQASLNLGNYFERRDNNGNQVCCGQYPYPPSLDSLKDQRQAKPTQRLVYVNKADYVLTNSFLITSLYETSISTNLILLLMSDKKGHLGSINLEERFAD